MESSKRIQRPSVKLLEQEMSELEERLEVLLRTKISEISDNSEIIDIASTCKQLFSKYCDVNFKLVSKMTDSGAITEAEELRNSRIDLKNEVKEMIKLINVSLGEYANISFNSSFVSSYEHTLQNIEPEVANLTVHNQYEKINSEIGEPPARLPHFLSSTPLPVSTTEWRNNMATFPLDREGHVGPSYQTYVPKLSTVSSLLPPIVRAPENFTVGSSVTSFVPTLTSVIRPPQSVTISSLRPQQPVAHSSYFRPTVTQVTSTIGFSFPRPQPIYTVSTSSLPPFQPRITSSAYAYPLHQNTTSTYAIPHTQPVSVTLPSHIPVFPQYPNANPPAAAFNAVPDPLTNQILRNQMFQRSSQPFDGEAHKYHAWLNVMERKMSGLQLEAWDVLTVLCENTTGKPRKIIDNLMTVGAADPQLTLNNVWNALYQQFGTGDRIAAAVINMINTFPCIKSSHHTEKLGDLVNICNIIRANMTVSEELQVFNLSSGMRKIWLKLPEALQNGWRTYSADFKRTHISSPSLSEFISFIERKLSEFSDLAYEKSFSSPKENNSKPVSGLTLKTNCNQTSQFSSESKAESPSHNSSNMDSSMSNACLLHPSGKHSLDLCNAFSKKPFAEKRAFIIEHKRCFLCLGPHFRNKCSTTVSCRSCGKRHATSMHRDESYESKSDSARNKDESNSNLCTKVCGGDRTKSCSKVLLVDVLLPSKSSKTLRCYAILDEQSTGCFIDPKVIQYFDASFSETEYSIRTLTGLQSSVSGLEVKGLAVKGVNQRKVISLPTVKTNSFIPNCKSEIATPNIVSQHRHIAHLAKNFSDIDAHAEVLLLIGRDCGPAMATQCFGHRAPYVHRTSLGWAMVGIACKSNTSSQPHSVFKTNVEANTAEHLCHSPVFTKRTSSQGVFSNPFLESPDDELPGPSKDDLKFMYKVTSEIHISDEGNITMPLPFKTECVTLPNNRAPVYHRMVNTLNKIKNDPAKLPQCIQSMQKNIISGHVEEVPKNELISGQPGKLWYIPVFPVVHSKKHSIRLVFDSTASYLGTSLNKELLQGPDMNLQLTTVLLRFREGTVGFTADIESMFYAFHLRQEDRDYTRFFWWKNNNPSEKLVEYRATRHIFGNKSSPSLANYGLRFAVLNSPHSTERARNFVQNNFYVDDGCGSANSIQEAINTLKETRTALSFYNIRLHKISSSSPEMLLAFPTSELNESIDNKDFNNLSCQRALGVEWNPSVDSFIIRTNVPHKPFTKRGTLATTNSLFDPLGFVSPVVLTGRLLQRFFIPPKNGNADILKLDWDDPLPEEHRHLWDDWIEELRNYDGKVHIKRSYLPTTFGSITEQSLHVFCDASEEGIGCVIYLRSVNLSNEIQVSLVAANSRVTPRGSTTIPRLELCAALEGSLLAYKVAQDINIKLRDVRFYTDSRVVLGYLFNTSTRFSRYITRRVSTILKTTSEVQWFYIPTDLNPGDIASRPQSFRSLTESCWFRGPAFLWSDSLPDYPTPETSIELPEAINEVSSFRVTLSSHQKSALHDTCSRVDSWNKLINVTRIVLDFIGRLSEKSALRNGKCIVPKPPSSVDTATLTVIRCLQIDGYPDCFPKLPSSLPDNLLSLSPFVEDSILRVGGRLKHSKVLTAVKFPVLLPADSLGTTLLIKHFHEKKRHQGRVITSAAIREAGYYVQGLTKAVKKLISSCTTCRRLRQPCSDQRMSDLPHDRLEESPPFTYVGMDVFGHYFVSEGVTTRRHSSLKKVWAVVFICLVTKAVHVEPLSQMDTSSFKLAFRRFCCIRGVCRKLRCDRGTNFVGAYNQEVLCIDLDSLRQEMTNNNIEWEFNPPHSSHFGGLWERSIRSFRKILDASLLILGKRPPTREEFHTFLHEASSIINNTPLYEISHDPNDELPLTPAKLMTLKDSPNPASIEIFNERDLLAYGTRRWRRVQALSEDFWHRWRTEFLHQLQNRQKWHKEKPNLNKGDIVLLKIKGSRRNCWPLARVNDVKLSKDGCVRSATLSLPSSGCTKPKLIERPITEIVPIIKCEGSSFE